MRQMKQDMEEREHRNNSNILRLKTKLKVQQSENTELKKTLQSVFRYHVIVDHLYNIKVFSLINSTLLFLLFIYYKLNITYIHIMK